jgi:hypothetical protein
MECPCNFTPMESTCGVWAGNESACVCAVSALEAPGPPLPS